jgi:hypothetical protein
MKNDCIKLVEQTIGRALGRGEAERIEQRLAANFRELARTDPGFQGMSHNDRLIAAAKKSMEQDQGEAARAAQRKALNLTAQIREVQAQAVRASEFSGKNRFHQALFERLVQLDNYVTGVRNELFGNLVDTIRASSPKFLGLIENREAATRFVREVYGEKTGDAEAAKAAKSYLDVMEKIRLRENASGADIAKLDYGYLPQPHDTGAVARAGKEQWVAKVAPLMKRDRFVNADGTQMNDAELNDLLSYAYDTIATNGQVRREAGQGGQGSRASRFDDKHRVLHFKDADSYLKYLDEFGEGSTFEAIHNHVGAHAKNIGLMESFGSNPNSTYRLLKDTAEIEDSRAAGKEVTGVTKFMATPDMIYDTISGATAAPVNARGAAVGQAVRNYTGATKLGGVMLSSINDVPTWLATAKYNGIPLGEALPEAMKAIGSSNIAEDAARLGLAVESMSGEMQTWHAGNMRNSWSGKLANATMRLQFVESWTQRLRAGMGIMLSDHLASLTREKSWGDLSTFDRERMTKAGVTERDWQVWQAATPENIRDRDLLTVNAIRETPDAALDAILSPDHDKIRAEAQAQIKELDDRTAQDGKWLRAREAKLSSWLADAKARLAARTAAFDENTDAATRAAVERLSGKVSRLQEAVDVSAESWSTPQGDMPGVDSSRPVAFYGKRSLRKLGKEEGGAIAKIDAIEKQIADLDADARANREAFGKTGFDKLFSDFMERRADLDAYAKRAQERADRRAFVTDRIARSVAPQQAASRASAANHAAAALLGFIDNEAKTAVIAPDVVTRAAMTQGARAGTLGGELGRSVMLFKSFPLAMLLRNLDRIRDLGKDGAPVSRAAYSAALMVGLTLFGALSVELKDLASGKNPRDATTGKFWGAAFAQGGGLGIFGDMLYTGMGGNSRGGQPNWSSLAGPVLGTGVDALNVTLGNLGQALQGKETHAGAEALRFTRQNLPLLNLWYAKAAIDHMGFQALQESLSPGYLARQRAQAQKDWGQTYWWQPGAGLPDEAPRLAEAVGE